jgi:hypothetical protein
MLRRYRGQIIINAGSVGLPIERTRNPPWAEYALITAQDGALGIELRRVPIDVGRLIQVALSSGMPHSDWWAGDWGLTNLKSAGWTMTALSPFPSENAPLRLGNRPISLRKRPIFSQEMPRPRKMPHRSGKSLFLSRKGPKKTPFPLSPDASQFFSHFAYRRSAHNVVPLFFIKIIGGYMKLADGQLIV